MPRLTRRLAVATSFALAVVVAAPVAHAQRVRLSLESRGDVYAGVPVVLDLIAEGFAEDPAPKQPPLEIAGCQVTPLGMTPNVSSSITIINGRRSERHDVTFVYRYQVVAPRAGRYQVPVLTVYQSGKSASTSATGFDVVDVATSRDMQFRVELPDRPIWIGEVFDVAIDWYLTRDPSDQTFLIPLFDHEDWVQVSAPPAAQGQRTLAFSVGGRELDLPFSVDQTELDGARYTRFRFHARVTPTRAGTLDLEPARVVAKLQVGTGRDRFGFPSARLKMFQALDRPRQLEIRQLPLKDRPRSFSNAVGSAFSIDVQASSTVVRVGEPVELKIQLHSSSPLEGLSLPKLDDAGLPANLFDIADEAPVGELTDDGKSKLFRVTVRPKSAEARSIPPLAFSYFDPAQSTYQTVTSKEIALQVAGSAMVGANDVVVAPNAESASHDPMAADPTPHHLGATLSLSDSSTSLRRVLALDDLRPFLWLLYLLPLGFLGFRVWQERTGARRNLRGAIRSKRRAVEAAASAAARTPAREAGPAIVAALRALARAVDPALLKNTPLIDELETRAFDPDAASAPLPTELRDRAVALAREWAATGPEKSSAGSAASAVAIAIALSWPHPADAAPAAAAAPTPAAAPAPAPAPAPAAAPAPAPAPAPAAAAAPADRLRAARDAYAAGLAERTDRSRRAAEFTRAEALFRDLVAEHPDRPELLADWGNAALGARDFGHATLAYRRALRLDPGLERAKRNLAWLRANGPSWLPDGASHGAIDSLFFWHRRLTVAQRHIIGAVAFALMIVLIAPWPRRRLLRKLAVLPLLVWLAMMGSLWFQRDLSHDVVVVNDGVVLRSADSAGAPPAQATPLPAGVEATLAESRGDWVRVELADGSRGWLPASAIEYVVPRPSSRT